MTEMLLSGSTGTAAGSDGLKAHVFSMLPGCSWVSGFMRIAHWMLPSPIQQTEVSPWLALEPFLGWFLAAWGKWWAPGISWEGALFLTFAPVPRASECHRRFGGWSLKHLDGLSGMTFSLRTVYKSRFCYLPSWTQSMDQAVNYCCLGPKVRASAA